MSIFSCPVCKELLIAENRTYKCTNGHCFDMAKEGYVNLLIGSKSSEFSGDDKEMVRARTQFLEGGYYEPLREKICSLIKSHCAENPVILDAGCGEGYYTGAYASLSGKTYGIDISKNAVRHAAKKYTNVDFAVGSVYHLPIGNDSVDMIINCFSPNAPDEFLRVLKKDGYLLYVVPGAKHLWELKNVLYENPYENEEKTENYDGFELIDIVSAGNSFTLQTPEDIQALFHMTPYTWKTPKDGAERLAKLQTLDVTADFKIHIFKCNKQK